MGAFPASVAGDRQHPVTALTPQCSKYSRIGGNPGDADGIYQKSDAEPRLHVVADRSRPFLNVCQPFWTILDRWPTVLDRS